MSDIPNTDPLDQLRTTMEKAGFITRTVVDRGTIIGVLAWNPTKPLPASKVEMRDRALFVASPEHQCVFVIGALGTVNEKDGKTGHAFICPWAIIPQALIWSQAIGGPSSPIPLWNYQNLPLQAAALGLHQWIAWRSAMDEMIEDRINTTWTTDQLGPRLGAALSEVLG